MKKKKRKSEWITILATSTEKKRWMKKAKAVGLTRSAWIRTTLNNQVSSNHKLISTTRNGAGDYTLVFKK